MTIVRQNEYFSIAEIRQELRNRAPKPTPPSATSSPHRDALARIDTPTLVEMLTYDSKLIYGTDDRQDLFEVSDPTILNNAGAVAAMVSAHNLLDNGNGTFSLKTVSYGKSADLCSSEPFFSQPVPVSPHCTAFLVTPNIMATAGHCIDQIDLSKFRFIFGFRMLNEHNANLVYSDNDIFQGISVIAYENLRNGLDFALVRLDRAVHSRPITSLRRVGKIKNNANVYVIGHPSGLPAKYAPGAHVRDNTNSAFFVANLDTYGGNSGSPVFNQETHDVEGILVRGETDFVFDDNCWVSNVCPMAGCSGEDVCRSTTFADHLPSIDSLMPRIVFNDVPEGQERLRAAVFSIKSRYQPIELEATVEPSDIFSMPDGETIQFNPNLGSSYETQGRIWVAFRGKKANDVSTGLMTVVCPETGERWEIPIEAKTILKPTVATALVLDRSGSMKDDAGLGNGQRRIDVLREAAGVFVDLMNDDDGIGVSSFNQDATVDTDVQRAGARSSLNGRVYARAAIRDLDPTGTTSIGDGIKVGHDIVSKASEYDYRALVVLTDGYENSPLYISDVGELINTRVFAIGLGTPEMLKPAALDAITKKSRDRVTTYTGGYLMMTGAHKVDILRLGKYFLQVLAGVENHDIVLDPRGRLVAGESSTLKVPFSLTDSDSSVDVVVLLPPWGDIEVSLETPNGETVYPDHHGRHTNGFTYGTSENLRYWRLTLPGIIEDERVHGGVWHAVLNLLEGTPVPYNLLIKAISNLNMRAKLIQESPRPGGRIVISADITEHGLHLQKTPTVTAYLEHPRRGTPFPIDLRQTLPEDRPCRFEADLWIPEPGSYEIRVLAQGINHRGQSFTREQLLSGLVWDEEDDHPAVSNGELREGPPRREDRVMPPENERL